MSFKNQLSTATKGVAFTDTGAIFLQGRRAYDAMFTRAANPYKTDRDRDVWDKGFAEAQEQFMSMLARWREADRGTR